MKRSLLDRAALLVPRSWTPFAASPRFPVAPKLLNSDLTPEDEINVCVKDVLYRSCRRPFFSLLFLRGLPPATLDEARSGTPEIKRGSALKGLQKVKT